MLRYLALSGLLIVSVACGDDMVEEIAAPPPPPPPATDVTAEEEALANEAVQAAGEAIRAITSVSSVGVNSADAQDETSDAPETPISADDPCVSVTLASDLSLTVDHGTGCEIGSAYISGAYVLRLLNENELGLEVEFQSFSVDALGIDGMLSASIKADRIDAMMDLDVTIDGTTHSLDFMGDLRIVQGALVVDGSGSYGTGTDPWTFDVDAVGYMPGACYPDAGTMTLSLPNGFPVTLTFSETTPQTGLVQVQVGTVQLPPLALPAYGRCPTGM